MFVRTNRTRQSGMVLGFTPKTNDLHDLPYRICRAASSTGYGPGNTLSDNELSTWFVEEVLPLEGLLERYLRRNWRDHDEIPDLRQEVYARVYDSCAAARPLSARAFVLSTARNLLIDRVRRAQVVSIETYADIERMSTLQDELSPERHLSARSELRLLQAALDGLPPRCREVVELRKIEGLSQREVAARMGIAEDTVEKQVAKGVRALAQALRDGVNGEAADEATFPARRHGKGSA